jgi:hypothetical protein
VARGEMCVTTIITAREAALDSDESEMTRAE